MATTTITAATITDEQIERLEQEAGNAGDLEQAQLCRRALDGDTAARAECERVIRDAQGMTTWAMEIDGNTRSRLYAMSTAAEREALDRLHKRRGSDADAKALRGLAGRHSRDLELQLEREIEPLLFQV